MIRAAAEGVDPDPLIDLSQIDFDALAARFAGRKRSETERLASLLRERERRRGSHGTRRGTSSSSGSSSSSPSTTPAASTSTSTSAG